MPLLFSAAAPSFFCLALLLSGGVGLRPSAGQAAVVVFPPWVSPEASVAAVAGAGGALIAVGSTGRRVRVAFDAEPSLWRLYASGAVLVWRTGQRLCTAEQGV
jgi:hypothetical protein